MTTSARGHQVKCNRGFSSISSYGFRFRFNARDRNHRAVSSATALDGHYPKSQHPSFDMEPCPGWDGMGLSVRWLVAATVTIYASALIVGPLPLCICNRAFRKLIQFMLILWQITGKRRKSAGDPATDTTGSWRAPCPRTWLKGL